MVASKVVCIHKQTQGKITIYSCLVCRIGDEVMRRRQLNKSLENMAKFKYLEFTPINVPRLKYVAQFRHLETILTEETPTRCNSVSKFYYSLF